MLTLPKGLILLCLGIFPLSTKPFILDADGSTSNYLDASNVRKDGAKDGKFGDSDNSDLGLFDRSQRGRSRGGGKPTDVQMTEIRMRKSDPALLHPQSFFGENDDGDFVISDVRMKKSNFRLLEDDSWTSDPEVKASVASLLDILLSSVIRRSENRQRQAMARNANKRLAPEVQMSDIRMKRDNLTGAAAKSQDQEEGAKTSLDQGLSPGNIALDNALDELVRISDVRMRRNRLPESPPYGESILNPFWTRVSTRFNVELFPLLAEQTYIPRSKRSVQDDDEAGLDNLLAGEHGQRGGQDLQGGRLAILEQKDKDAYDGKNQERTPPFQNTLGQPRMEKKARSSSKDVKQRLLQARMKKGKGRKKGEQFLMSDVRMKKGSNGLRNKNYNLASTMMSDVRMKKNTESNQAEEEEDSFNTMMSDVRMKKNEADLSEDWSPSSQMRMSEVRMKKSKEDNNWYNTVMSDIRMKKNQADWNEEDWHPLNHMRMSDVRMKKDMEDNKLEEEGWLMSDIRMKKHMEGKQDREEAPFQNMRMSDVRMKKKDQAASQDDQDWFPSMMSDVRMKRKNNKAITQQQQHSDDSYIMSDIRMKKQMELLDDQELRGGLEPSRNSLQDDSSYPAVRDGGIWESRGDVRK